MWPDQQTILQIIIFVFFAGAAIVQVLFRVLAKGGQRPRAGGPREAAPGPARGEKPFRDVREFLKEIRAEAEKAAGRPQETGRQREEKKTPPQEELVWEVVEGPGAPARRPRDRPGRQPAQGRERAAAEPAARPGRSVHEYLDDLARRERAAEDEARASTPVDEGSFPGPELETAIGKRQARGAGKSPPRSGAGAGRGRPRPRSAPLLEGLTLRDAMIAHVILGPPLSKGPRRPRR